MVLNFFSNNNQNNNNQNDSLKSYSIVDFPNEKKDYGNFEGKSAKSAAHYAFDDLLKFSNIKDDDLEGKFIVFVLKNKQNSKEYKYTGTRVLLKNPVTLDGKEYKYKNVIAKYTPDFDKLKYNK
jgi:hypothetical protein